MSRCSVRFAAWVPLLLAHITLYPAAGQKVEAAETEAARVVVQSGQGRHTIDRNVYGHFAEHLGRCIYEGIWVGPQSPIPNTRGIRNDVVAALRAIDIPVLRWPGGCFADEYHWEDGIGPLQKRPAMINTHWGGVVENNHFGTHEFLDLCEQLDCQPYICGNVGSGTVREMQQWVEYVTFDGTSPMALLRQENGRAEPWRLPYFGVGNENWGCGGHMRAEYYADLYRRYATYVRNFGENRIMKIACGPNRDDYHWTEVLMREAGKQMWGLSMHYYCGTGKKSRSATEFTEVDWFHQLNSALRMDELIRKHSEIMDQHDPQRRVALVVDEWGAWHAVEPGTNPRFLYQQNSIRDALVAGITLNIFHQHCQRVRMANIAQTINVLQAMILTDQERMVLTPTYHVFEMYKVHQEATMLPVAVTCGEYRFQRDSVPQLSASASKDAAGAVHISLCNLDPNRAVAVECVLQGIEGTSVTGRVLTADAMQAHNTFDAPEQVKPKTLEGIERTDKGLTVTLPAKSVAVIEVR
ncbi:MAG: alpha-N-arabinofuranosidase [Planctomycetota bacterium]